jgi:uncharacterized protein YndB with AHSA1/START domain
MKKIIHHLQIKASPEAVFDSIATGAGLSKWWSKVVDAEERVGGLIKFTFVADFNPHMEVTDLDRPNAVDWTCVAGHEPWDANTFRFLISAEGDAAALHFTQEYARELDDQQYGTYNFNWGYYLESLRQFSEGGHGKPFDPATGKSG